MQRTVFRPCSLIPKEHFIDEGSQHGVALLLHLFNQLRVAAVELHRKGARSRLFPSKESPITVPYRTQVDYFGIWLDIKVARTEQVISVPKEILRQARSNQCLIVKYIRAQFTGIRIQPPCVSSTEALVEELTYVLHFFVSGNLRSMNRKVVTPGIECRELLTSLIVKLNQVTACDVVGVV